MDMTWISTKDRLPEENVSVLVFIPEEDNHITTGMWDVSKKWVLLDDYRVPTAQVTYWHEMIPAPSDGTYEPTHFPSEEDTMTNTIRSLQKRNYEVEQALKQAKEALQKSEGVIELVAGLYPRSEAVQCLSNHRAALEIINKLIS